MTSPSLRHSSINLVEESSLPETGTKVPEHSGGVRKLATFWHGAPPSHLDISCLLSFRRNGFEVEVYSYDPLSGLPAELEARDAASIVDKRFLHAFVVNGKPSLSHFTDLFRYELFRGSEAVWIDTDLLCLRDFYIPAEGHFFSKESSERLNGAILRLDRRAPGFDRLIEEAKAFAAGTNFPWGSTGPRLITRHFGPAALEHALAVECFYPVHWDLWWMPFLPAYADECRALCGTSFALHLWNNIVDKAAVWKDLAPPRGSFLHASLQDLGLIDRFNDVMPERIMNGLVANYHAMQNGDAMPLRGLVGVVAKRAKAKLIERLGL